MKAGRDEGRRLGYKYAVNDLTPGTKNPATVHDNSGMPAKYFTQVLHIEDIRSMHELVVRTFDQVQMLPSPANAALRYCSHLCP